jgi:hypothetical protein
MVICAAKYRNIFRGGARVALEQSHYLRPFLIMFGPQNSLLITLKDQIGALQVLRPGTKCLPLLT